MTAVDHAELKRVAEGARDRAALLGRLDAFSEVSDFLTALADGTCALLSEIEGLKAELDSVWVKVEDTARRYARCYPEASDGRNTFVMFAEWAASQAALRTQAPDSWRPIETAPKDGTRFIAYGLWTPTWKEAEPHVEVMWRYDDDEYCEAIGGKVTHWMPLPAAPALRPQTAESV